ncbi:MAG: ADP-forming succinate--CoA ligase subunit beta [Verrucomicrobia bacterium]|nr:MAG: ADP-forming succinate--CoA ligase subunit beta [Verrucomicrobiota bacterium]PYL19377.1 MAG: ADP-forming succinate--CoA ligase subunit beta [Verrucomicrobiota bacterium]
MNIHEYQAKELLQKFDVATTHGKVAATVDEAEQIARELGAVDVVVKAQIHAGGRGKGTFKNGFKGGVHVRKTPEEVREVASKMLGQILVTHQTGSAGRMVNKVLVAESAEIAREIYFAVLLDRATAAPLIVASTEGGVEIETVAAKSPEKIIREAVDPLAGLQPFQTRKLAKQLAFESSQLKSASKLFERLYHTFIAFDCSMVEVNPLVVTMKGEALALDAKFNFDDNALYRHPEIAALRDIAEEDPREVEASKRGLSYIGLDGNIACLVNGAGLAMATMDIIKFYGGEPANFLDVGGGATEEQVTDAFKILIADKKVKAILVNIFGGIMKCDVIAQGIINAAKTVKLSEPLVVRLEGTNVERGKQLLKESGLALIAADDLADAAQKAVAAAATVNSKSQSPSSK